MKDDIVLFCIHCRRSPPRSVSFDIRVYDRNNMTEVKDVIALPGIRPAIVVACNVSNCVYILEQQRDTDCSSIFRLTKVGENHFNIQTWISDLTFCVSSISASISGSLIIISSPDDTDSNAVSIYNPDGSLQQEVMLSPDIYEFRYVKSVIQRANGNLVLASDSEQFQTVLTEFNAGGIIERQYKSSLSGRSDMNVSDAYERILINDPENGIELLDSELNLLSFTGPQPNKEDFIIHYSLHYNSERNEVMGNCVVDSETSVLTIFRLVEE